MECHECGTEVSDGQRFCHECGSSLRGVTDATEPVEPVAPTGGEPAEPAATPASGLPTEPVDIHAARADASWAEPPPSDAEPEPDTTTTIGVTTADPTGPPTPYDAAGPTTTLDETGTPLGPPPDPADAEATTRLPSSATDTDELPAPQATTLLAAGGPGTTDEIPAVFDGVEHVSEHPPGREPFQIRLIFLLAFFGAVTMVMSTVADLTDIRTTRPIDGIGIGTTSLHDVGVNLPAAGFSGAVVMVLGGFLACFGFRWGAGLAGGAGLALAGWAGLTIGLVEVPIAVSESITRTSGELFTLTVTRDTGYWLVVAAGVMGLLVFVASLRSAGTGGRRSLNPWVAAVGAVSSVILAAGPLIPEGEATFSDNFRSPNALIDLPTAYFGGRIGQLALIAFAGVVGFLLVRVYGLGLAAGGISVAFWLWLASLLGIGEDVIAGVRPLGIAAGNFGAGDTEPHAVTSVGMVLMLLMLLVATALAVAQWRRTRYD